LVEPRFVADRGDRASLAGEWASRKAADRPIGRRGRAAAPLGSWLPTG